MRRRPGPLVSAARLLVAMATVIASAGLQLGCGEESITVLLVTVDARASVPDADSLEVIISNDSATISEEFDLRGKSFPLDFTVTATGRTGEIALVLSAKDSNGRVTSRGRGSGTLVTDTRTDASVLLEPEDFVVNGSTAGDQRLTFDPERSGRQLSALGDGSFVIAFLNDCAQLGRCDLFSRLYDSQARPQVNDSTQDDRELIVNQSDQLAYEPATAVNDAGTLIAWPEGTVVRATLLTPTGGHKTSDDPVLSTADFADFPAVAGLPDNRFVVVWAETDGSDTTIAGRLVGPSGEPLTNPVTMNDGVFPISTAGVGAFATRPAVAATGDGLGFVVVWFDRETLYGRFFGTDGLPRPTTQVQLASYGSSAEIFGPRVTWADGTALVLWGIRAFDPPGYANGVWIMRRFAAPTGVPDGSEITIATQTPDVYSMPAVTTRADGAVALAWHQCGSLGDGGGCGVFAQVYRPTGLPVGALIPVNTTTSGDQTHPSIGPVPDGFVVAWSDESGAPPDTSPAAVRARVIYPAYDPNDGRLGARCGRPDDAQCAADTVCSARSESVARGHPRCDPLGPPPHCPSGGICTGSGEQAACLF